MKRVGFIGMGIMGRAMAKNLLEAGYELFIYSRTRDKASELEEMGAVWCENAGELSKRCQAVITTVGFPEDVEQVYFGETGILDSAYEGSYLIDMTTTSPKLSAKIFRSAKSRGLRALDAPVSGGDSGAKSATLAIMVGGEKEDFDACLPIFQSMGKEICYMGGAGAGQHTKMANQIAISGAIAGLCEAIVYAEEAGINAAKMLEAIRTGAAGSAQLEIFGPRILKRDFAPGFYIKHFIKDMAIAKEELASSKVRLEVLDKVFDMYCWLEKKDKGTLGTQALIQYYE
ncbi:MAG: NAD(P)-dependent oxidoreductase [Coprococcus sp.]|nr:NAD(P)-dependent oxidoreductase [Coprococcus sp.]